MTWLKSPGFCLTPARLRFLVLALASSLAACAPVAVRPGPGEAMAAQRARAVALASVRDWSFSGRIALSQDGRGGSGRIDWRQQQDRIEVRLTAPVTGQSWRLVQTPGQAVLEGLEGGPREGPDAAALVAEATGWTLPVAALSDWVRGLGDEDSAALEFGPDGRLARLQDAGWTVEFRAWNGQRPALPTKLYARHEQASVRLVIDHWSQP